MDEQHQNEAILTAIRKGDREALKKLYSRNRTAFLDWASRRYKVREDDLLDIFQEAVTAFYLLVVDRKIEEINVSVDAYVFGIAKKMLFRSFGKKRDEIPLGENEEHLLPPIPAEILEEMELTHQQKLIRDALQHLSPVCRELLTLFYYHDHGLEVIAEQMNYKNTDTVKSQKNRCMEKLRALFQTPLKKESHG